jgi:hypothetical protein
LAGGFWASARDGFNQLNSVTPTGVQFKVSVFMFVYASGEIELCHDQTRIKKIDDQGRRLDVSVLVTMQRNIDLLGAKP